jgi:hypothetical protein
MRQSPVQQGRRGLQQSSREISHKRTRLTAASILCRSGYRNLDKHEMLRPGRSSRLHRTIQVQLSEGSNAASQVRGISGSHTSALYAFVAIRPTEEERKEKGSIGEMGSDCAAYRLFMPLLILICRCY